MNQFVRHLSCAVLLMGLLSSCSGPKSPDFVGLKNVQIDYNVQNKLNLKALAVYNNPNLIGGNLSRTDMKLFIDGVEVSHIQQEESIAIPAQSDFEIPVNITIDPIKLQQENEGLLRNVLKQVLNNDLELRYAGKVYVSIVDREFGIPVDYSEKIKLGLTYEETTD